MTGSSRLSLDMLRAAIARFDRATDPPDVATALAEAWEGAESALQHLAGTGTLRGQDLLRELRGRNLLTLREAHAVVDLGGLAERVGAGHQPTREERDAAREMCATIVAVLERRGPPAQAATAHPAAEPLPPLPLPQPDGPPRRNLIGRAMIAGVLLVLVGGGGWVVWDLQREPTELRRGRAAYAAGDRLGARNAFSAASGRFPKLAEPLIYLGRISREEGDLASAREYLRRAIVLEPTNSLGHRELGSVLLASGRPDLARSFYERAIRLDPQDKTALGYMGCALMRLGQVPVAQRFLSRAGAGPWSACATLLPPVSPPPAPPGS
ncbi:MAG: tetratricopeptide repeat protein [Gemmatimonadetes bacterium]|nr:tetratricopeptide repeat protein [Gemmatimonadota bacterium]